jgi:L-aminopeptidase/D-esterase-like protein
VAPARSGPLNLITDVAGLTVGNAENRGIVTGVTVVVPDEPAEAAVELRGGAPGTRETDALDPTAIAGQAHAVVLSGGSVFGLDAASGVTDALAARGIGFRFGLQPLACPVVPAAILFDLLNGGNKDFAGAPPYDRLGREALANAAKHFALGNAGAGYGAICGRLKGGLGSASAVLEGFTVGALVAVNSFGSAVNPATGALWAAPFALDGEFGDEPARRSADETWHAVFAGSKAERAEPATGQSTTIAVVATDAILSKTEVSRLATMAADGLPRAIRPIHTPYDGDCVFALATARQILPESRTRALAALGTLAADALARAVGRALWEATAIPGWPAYRLSR